MPSWTKVREPDMQTCPELKNAAKWDYPRARSKFASLSIMFGFFPPSSKVTLFMPPFIRIFFPISVEPVNAILSTPLCLTMASPAFSPKPGSTFTTPSGIPTS